MQGAGDGGGVGCAEDFGAVGGLVCRRLIRREMLFLSSGGSLPCSD
ncbi:hypothetical protein SBI_07374 [Streptomyces bingchenggensis BCW-1]|uniref:Uncharacterized protein n=1 Tax=Streptomyces bingchenggensis (strain BCW-1) TaxID=749414 RepID=D7C7E0_STRBB|nr:hypothetical protein SBI_07374 [Streptomyces bingchenggensis BCW-1]